MRNAANQAHEKAEKSTAQRGTKPQQTTFVKLEEQLKAAWLEKKKLAAQVGNCATHKSAAQRLEDEVCEEEDTVNVEELQTLLELSNNHIPDSDHTKKLRAAEKLKKQTTSH